jgi:hypothetical protein
MNTKGLKVKIFCEQRERALEQLISDWLEINIVDMIQVIQSECENTTTITLFYKDIPEESQQ